MKGRFRGLYARAFCHATEDLERVKLAVLNTIGPTELSARRTEGVHGNPITIVEGEVDSEDVGNFFSRLSGSDLNTLSDTLSKRIDEGCNLFVKIDKQSAYLGQVVLGAGNDVISIRIRVSAFPAKCEVAEGVVKEAIDQELAWRQEQPEARGPRP